MTEWVDFAIYAVLMAALFFIQPRAARKLTVPLLADRNPQWVAENSEAVLKIERSQWFLWVLHGAGAAGIATLAAVQFGLLDLAPGPLPDGSPVEKWMTLWDVNVGFILLGVVLLGGAGLLFWFRLYRQIPLANRRHAALERRSIDHFVSRWVRYAAYVLIVANLAAWVVAGIVGAYSTPLFWTRFVLLIALTGIFAFFTRVSINRRPNVMDRILGPGNRRTEARFNFACQLLPPVIGAVRLYEEVNDTALMDINRAMFLALALMVIFGLLRTIHLPARPKGLDSPRDVGHDISRA